MNAPPIIFRCRVGSTVGLGHLMRCRELTRALRDRGRDSVLIGPDEALLNDNDRALFRACHPVGVRGTAATDAGRVLTVAAEHGARAAVMDDYRIEPEYGATLRENGLRFLQQFDASKPRLYHADILVNSGPFERPEHYTAYLQNPATRLLLGPDYAVLRPDFRDTAPRETPLSVRRIFVCFGGGDDRGAIAMTIEALGPLLDRGIALDVVAGNGNPRKDDLATMIASLSESGVQFHVDAPNVAELMRSADLAVIAGGTMSYETAICGVPPVLIALAENQVRSCRGWQEKTGAPFIGALDEVTTDRLRGALEALTGDFALRASIASAGRSLVDGHGTARVVDAILGLEQQ